LIILNINSGFR